MDRSFSTRSHLKRGTRTVGLNSSSITPHGKNHTLVQVGKGCPSYSDLSKDADAASFLPVRMWNDWAWLVRDAKIVVWRHTSSKEAVRSGIYEFGLPDTGLIHKVDLVHVFSDPTNPDSVACLAVLPEGKLVLWPDILRTSPRIEMILDLGGQECEGLVPVWPVGCLLTTTSGNVILLAPDLESTPEKVEYRPLRVFQGMFAGVRHRLANMIFGHSMEQGVQKIVRVAAAWNDDALDVYVMVGSILRKWCVTPTLDGYDNLVAECHIDSLLRKAYGEQLKLSEDRVCTWILDMTWSQAGVVVLAGGAKVDSQDDGIHVCVGFLDVGNEDVPARFTKLLDVRREVVSSNFEASLSAHRLLAAGGFLAVYHPTFLCCLSVDKGVGKRMTCFQIENDTLVGWGVAGESNDEAASLYFHSANAGTFKLLRNYVLPQTEEFSASMLDASSLRSMDASERSIRDDRSVCEESVKTDVDRFETESTSSVFGGHRAPAIRRINRKAIDAMCNCDDSSVRLKAAVILYAADEEIVAREILSKMLPQGMMQQWAGSCDAFLDKTVIACSRDNILDDYPTHDPRWSSRIGPGTGGVTNSMVLMHQVKDKRKVHNIFMEFLMSTNLMTVLATVNVDQRVMATCHVLAEDAEKLCVAEMLLTLRPKVGHVFDELLKAINVERSEKERSIPKLELFFRKISSVGKFFTHGLHEWQKISSDPQFDVENEVWRSQVISFTKLLSTCLESVMDMRMENPDLYVIPENMDFHWEYVPWTSSKDFRNMIIRQLEICVQSGGFDPRKGELYVALERPVQILVDFLLDGYKKQLDSMPKQGRFDAVREEFLKLRKQYLVLLCDRRDCEDFALRKAEEYRDFDLICKIGFRSSDWTLVKNFCDLFADENFAEHAFLWLLKNKRRGDALKFALAIQCEETIKKFPNMYWAYLGEQNRYQDAAKVMHTAAMREDTYAKRKLKMLAGARLFLALLQKQRSPGMLSSDEQEMSAEIQYEAEILQYQERVPKPVLANFGMKSFDEGAPPMNISDIIQVYASTENAEATPQMFAETFRASCLLRFNRGKVQRLRQYIWCCAMKRDDWKKVGVEEEEMRKTFAFRVAEEAFDVQPYFSDDVKLACIDALADITTCEELGPMRGSDDFTYKLGIFVELVANNFGIVQ